MGLQEAEAFEEWVPVRLVKGTFAWQSGVVFIRNEIEVPSDKRPQLVRSFSERLKLLSPNFRTSGREVNPKELKCSARTRPERLELQKHRVPGEFRGKGQPRNPIVSECPWPHNYQSPSSIVCPITVMELVTWPWEFAGERECV